MEEHMQDSLVDEEIDKSVQKIKKLFSYGMQQSSCVFVPDEKVSSVTFQTSFEPVEVNEKAKEAEETFHQVLEEVMQQNQLPQYLYKILQEQKHETSLILEQYDMIILELSKSLVEYDKEYRQKCEKHSLQHQLLEENIEDLISEINRIGKEETQNIRMSVIQNTKIKINKYWEKCQKLLDDNAADIPFDDYLWKPPTTMLPVQELVDSFMIPQDEVVTRRREMLSKICELRKNLEREKLDHALKLEKFEKELFDVKENYKKKKIAFAKLKRKQTTLISRRDVLYKELKEIQKNIEKECEIQKKISEKHNENKKVKSYLHHENEIKYDCLFRERSIEVYNLLADIVTGMKFVIEHIFRIHGYSLNMDNFQINHKNVLSYLFEKGYWYDFIRAAPKMGLVDETLKVMESYWSHMKTYSNNLEEKRTLYLENKKFQKFLKHYHEFEE